VPLYEFECQNCQHRFEKIQSVSAPDPDCVKCGGKVERILHAPAVQFKGSGWYATDYAKKSSESSSKSEAKSTDKSDTSSTAKSESKGETKTQPKSDAKSTGSKE
jgi:putative FmdB family regulatory protein